ncbi:MAG: CHAD domain-containing protein [Solirubrobacterales bacterium]|nr:CHAD domain-containing protein [Solirubrobacterales bacterium]
MSSEIERKFLVARIPSWLGECSSTRIEQGYLAIAAEIEVRLRRAGADLTLTAKRGHGEVREEVELAFGPGQFAALWPLTADRRLTKTRHLVPLGNGLRAEVDVYRGALEGLVTAEVEFESEARSRWFRPPAWFGEELTGERRYSNQALASDGLPAAEGFPTHESVEEGKLQGMNGESEGGESRSYHLKRDEGAADGLRRVARGRVEKAAGRLRDADGEDRAKAIHGARKDLKKIRAVLRLLRDDLGAKRFRRENRRYRDAGRLLSASRDAGVKLATLNALQERFEAEFPAGQSLAWSEALEADRDEVAGAGEAADVERALSRIEKAGARIRSWPLEADSWELIEPGLTRSYRDGREALADARVEGSADNVHDLRKRAKDLWYHLRLLEKAWPGLLEETVEQVHRLTELLGDHHDLAVLGEDLQRRAGIVAERDAFQELIERRQAELLAESLDLGRRVYAELPKHFRRRLHAYWRVWREP